MRFLYFIPFKSEGNGYVEKTKKLAISNNKELQIFEFVNFKKLIKSPSIFFGYVSVKADFVILSWHENLLRSKSGNLCLIGFVKFLVYFFIYRISSKKIIYIRHNLYPHGMKGIQAKLAYHLTNLIEYFCDAKVSHSGHLVERGYNYIPHPLYDLKKPVVFRESGKFKNKLSNYYVIFGRIARYKKIETIIERWNDEIPLLVAGSVSDYAYLNELIKMAERKSVIFDARFIEESEAQELIVKSKGMILVHADPDMIVSGSFFYAVTLGTPVYAVEKPFFRWLKKEKSFDGLHLYETPKELVDDLTSFKEGSLFRGEPNRDDVRRQAELLFGDAAVRNAWHDLLTRMAS